VRRAGERIRVSAQLIDARTNGHAWAERYDRPLGDTFVVQDEITTSIAARLGAAIERAETDVGRRKAPADLGAYDYYLQGRAKQRTSAKAAVLEGRELFRKAIALDPGFAPAYAELANTYYTEVALRWDPARREEALTEGLELARKAVAFDPALPLAHLTMGNLHLRRHDYDEAVRWSEAALAPSPNDPENHAGLANIYSFVGRAADALPLMQQAITLDPSYPPLYAMYIGRAYLLARQPEAAVPHLRDAAGRAPYFWPASLFLAAAYAHLGRPGEATAALAATRQFVRFTWVANY
jgi:tetratricopeptide (TPR) repeat protein